LGAEPSGAEQSGTERSGGEEKRRRQAGRQGGKEAGTQGPSCRDPAAGTEDRTNQSAELIQSNQIQSHRIESCLS
jgi:hypothetical protein